MLEITDFKSNYFKHKLKLAEERIFSHMHKYIRAKMSEENNKGMVSIHNVHSIIGANKIIWILGILTLKEDGNYYIEDSTLA
jgi:hypothetical protein